MIHHMRPMMHVLFALLLSPSAASADDAQAIARWLRTVAVDTSEGRYWPADALSSSAPDLELGSGSAGVVLFWIAMHRADRSAGYLDEVRRGADYLAANVRTTTEPSAPGEWTTGLYGPIAGSAFALHEAYRLTGDIRHRTAALHLVELLHTKAERNAGGASWGMTHDILTGAAGTGLFLLYAAKEMNHAASCDLARDAGRRLLLRAVPDGRGGMTWKAAYEGRFNLPNFSHGTAGIAYFLASLYEATGERVFLDGALAGANWLRGVADRSDGGFRVFYGWPDPGWQRPYDIGWAHGPAGTARLFYKLWVITGDAQWLELVRACARSLRASGLPDSPKAEYGSAFEQNQRFGKAGVAHFFLDLFRTMRDRADLELARVLARDIVNSSTRDPQSMKWKTKRPGFMNRAGQDAEFTSFFYGAAGYGMLLLAIDDAVKNRTPTRLPDDPFGQSRQR